MRIVVTGIAGAIGSHIAEHLVAEGHTVVGIDSLTPYYSRAIKGATLAELASRGVVTHILDLAQAELGDYLKDAEVIYHCAAQPGISSTTTFEEYAWNNIVATHRLLESARQLKTLKLFVMLSTSSVYGKDAVGSEGSEPKPTSHYGVTKLAAEQLALSYQREYAFPVTVLRLFSVYGPRERPEKLYHRLIQCIANDEAFPLYEGSQSHVRSFSYVSDIVDGCMAVLTHTPKCIGEIFNLGTAVTATTGEGISIIENLMGKKATFAIQPPRSGDQKETRAVIEKAKRLLGYDPRTRLEEGLEKQIQWYLDNIHGKIY